MTHVTSAAVVCAMGALLALFPSPLAAQTDSHAQTFGALAALATPGQRLVVTTADGDRVRGRLDAIEASVLGLDSGGRIREFREADVVEIRKRGDRLWNGALIGAGGGAGAGALFGQTRPSCDGSDAEFCAGLGALIGLGGGVLIGLAVDALMPHDDLLYARAPAVTQRWTLEPLLGGRGYGARLVRRF